MNCRFTDCAHSGDEGCAVDAAVASGELSARRLESWRSIRDEMVSQELSREQEVSSRKKKAGARNRGPRRHTTTRLVASTTRSGRDFQCEQWCGRLVDRLLVLELGLTVGDDPAAGLHRRDATA